MMAYLPTAFAPAAFRWLGLRDAPNKLMNVAVSSVVGPRERGHFGGAAVSEIYSTGVLSPGAPVNITVWSYVDRLGVAVLTDDRTFNDPHEATDAIGASFAELRDAAGVSAQPASTRVQRRVEQPEAVVGRAGQRLDGVLGMRHQTRRRGRWPN